jgi:hypothetical protein
MDYTNGGKFKISSSSAFGTNDRFVIDGAGKVGIGTSSPAYGLAAVIGTSAAYFTSSSNSSVYASFDFGSSNTLFNLSRAATNNNNAIMFKTGNVNKWALGVWQSDATENLSFSNGGLSGAKVLTLNSTTNNVGLGTTTPNQKLSLYTTVASGDNAIEFSGASGSTYKWSLGMDNGTGAFKISSSSALGTNDRFVIDGAGKVGINKSTPTAMFDVSVPTTFTSGNLQKIAASGATTLAGALTGVNLDLATNYTATGQSVMGQNVTLPSVTNTGNSIYEYTGMRITGNSLTQSSGSGNTYFRGLEIFNSNITQTSGAVLSYGIQVSPGTITTAGTQTGLYVSPVGVGAGTLYGMDVGAITAGAGTETAIRIGSGWDTILDTASLDITGAGAITGATGFNGLVVTANTGTITTGTWNGTAIGPTYGGTNQTTYATGDMLYASGANTLAKRTIGTTGQVLSVSGGVPTWTSTSSLNIAASVSIGSTITSATQGTVFFAGAAGALSQNNAQFFWNNTSSRLGLGTTTPNQKLALYNAAANTGLEFSAASGANYKWSIGMDYTNGGKFKISSSSAFGTNDRFVIDGAGKVGINKSTPTAMFDVAVPTTFTSGTLQSVAASGATTLTGVLTGVNLDLRTNYTATGFGMTGSQIQLPNVANTGAGTYTYLGESIGTSGATLSQATGAGTNTWTGSNILTPNITQSAGAVTANGAVITTGTITTAGTQNGLLVTAQGVSAGTLTGVNISTITGSTGTENAISVGTGWDKIFNSGAFSVAGTGATTYAPLTTFTTGTGISWAASGATTLSGALTGMNLNLATSYTATGQNVTGYAVTLPTVTNTGAGTYNYVGMNISGGALTQNTGAGTDSSVGAFITNSNITQTTGAVTAYGVLAVTGSITTGGTQTGVAVSATGVTAGTLNGMSISNITAGAGTETALLIGSGWDNAISANGFTVNGSGAISASTGITTSGNITAPLQGNNFIGASASNGVLFDGTGVYNLSTQSALGLANVFDTDNNSSGTFFVGKGAADPDSATHFLDITNAGNIGIGTTTPNQKLSIFNSANDAAIELSSASGPNYKWSMGIDYSDKAKFKISSSSVLGTNDRFVIDGGGNVGIGTANPQGRLGVSGGDIRVDGNYNVEWDDGTVGVYATAAAGMDIFTGGTSKMKILASGNVGIGDTSPAALLTVGSGDLFQVNSSGAIAASAAITTSGNLTLSGSAANIILGSNWLSGDGGDEGVFVTAAGSVGIASSTPADTFSVAGNAGFANYIKNYSYPGYGSSYGNMWFDGTGGSGNATATWIFGVGGSDAHGMTATSFGILDTTPDYNLDVAGTSGFDGLMTMTGSAANIALGSNYLSGDGGDEGIYVNSTGVVSIGTASPVGSATLHLETITNSGGTSALVIQGPAGDNNWGGGISLTSDNGTTVTAGIIASVSGLQLSYGGSTKLTVGSSAITADTQLTMNGSASNIALGSNYLSGDGGDEGVFVDASGNVSIGDAAPGAKLEVSGGSILLSTNNNSLLFTDTGGSQPAFTMQSDNNFVFYTTSSAGAQQAVWSATARNAGNAQLVVSAAGGMSVTGTLSGAASTYSGNLTLSGSSANIILGSNYLSGDGGDEGVFVDASGSVGIGDTSPAALLTVGSGDLFQVNSSGAIAAVDTVTITNDTGGSGLTIGRQDNTSEGGQISFVGAASYDGWTQDSYLHGMRFYTNSANTNSLDILNIGAGIANFSVEGTLTAAGGTISSGLTFSGSAANIILGSNYLSGDGGDEGVAVDSNGNVGIFQDQLSVCSGGACASTANGDGTVTAERAIVSEEATLGTTGSITINWDDGNQQRVNSSTGNMTFDFSNATAGQTLRLVVCYGGAHTITWTPTIKWAGGSAPTPTSTNGKCDVFSFLYTGTAYFGQPSLNF